MMDSETVSYGLMACLFLNVAGIALLGTSIGTRYWVEIDSTTVPDSHGGLFKFCTAGKCSSIDDTNFKSEDEIKKVRGLCITGIIFYALALFTMVYLAIERNKLNSRKIGTVILVLSVIGGLFAISGMARFVDEWEDANSSSVYGYSLHLAWVSAILVVLAGVLVIPVVKFLFENGQSTGPAMKRAQPPYLQPVAYPPGMAYPPQPMTYNNPVMMSNMNPYGQTQLNRSVSPGYLPSVPQYNYAGPSFVGQMYR